MPAADVVRPAEMQQKVAMYKHILLPTDGSGLSQKAAKECIALAECFGARLTVIHVMQRRRIRERSGIEREVEKHYHDVAKMNAGTLCARLKEDAKAKNVECTSLVVQGDEPYEAIIHQAVRLGCDLIVMASRPVRFKRAASRERNSEGANALQTAGLGGSLNSP